MSPARNWQTDWSNGPGHGAIQERLGPTALVVLEDDVVKLSAQLKGLGMKLEG